jgi:hypothetical protein
MTDDAILETIRRLLALGQSPNEHEATLALAKAQEWMLRYNLSMAEVESADAGRSDWVKAEAYRGGVRPPGELEFVTPIVQRFFFVRIVQIVQLPQRIGGAWDKQWVLFGRKENVAVAQHVLCYLRRTFRDLWETYRRNVGAARRDSQAFFWGLQCGLTEKLQAQREAAASAAEPGALVAVDGELTRRFQEAFPSIARNVKRVRGHEEVFAAGHERGRGIEIRPAVAGREQLRITDN